MDATLKLMEENRSHLDAIAKALIERNRLYRKDLEDVLPPMARKQESGNKEGQQ